MERAAVRLTRQTRTGEGHLPFRAAFIVWAGAARRAEERGPQRFFGEHGFAPATTYELVVDDRRYPPKAILGTAYEFATGERLASGDFEGGKGGAVSVLGKMGFTVQHV